LGDVESEISLMLLVVGLEEGMKGEKLVWRGGSISLQLQGGEGWKENWLSGLLPGFHPSFGA
jgi:hypothetical protein